jgi:predicted nuclease of restriction endonuclease-like (RecB) superfamily
MADITTILSKNEEYKQLINSLLQRIKQTRMQTAIGVNSQLIKLYWSIGRDIVKMQENNTYGDAFIYQLSEDLQREFPDVKGFSYRNLHYMKNMYLTFNQLDANLPQPVAESSEGNLPQPVAESALDYVALVPWGHIRYLLDKRYTSEKAFFYITQIIEHGWSRNMLLNMLSTDLYESKGVSVNNFVQTLPPVESDYAQEIIKDPYHFDFLSLTAEYKEKDLQHELESNISRFLIELGDGFAYVGRQVKLDINGDEYYCDLLFYHLRLRRYIVVELKTGKFEPEFVSKLNLYCTAVDHVYKTDIDGDTIGLLICKEKNDLVAQWTVEKSQQPIAITRYELNKILSK